MITAKNLSTAKIDFSKLPAKFKEDYGDVVEMVPYMDKEPDFKQVINSYVAGLNKELSKAKPKPASKAKTSAPKPKKEEPQPYNNWYEQMQFRIQNDIGVGRSDAAAMLQAKDFELQQAWTQGLNAQQTFDKLFQKKETPKPKAKGKAKAKKPRQSSADKTKKAAEIAAAKGRLNSMLFDAKKGNYQHLNRSQVLEMAQVFQSNRIKSAATLDGKMDSKKRLTPTPENLVRWMKEPGKYDLIGIDTFEKNNPTADLKIKKEIFWARLLKK